MIYLDPRCYPWSRLECPAQAQHGKEIKAFEETDGAINGLISLLDDDDVGVSIRALGLLSSMCLGVDDVNLRAAVYRQCQQEEHPTALSCVLKLLDSPDRDQRFDACRALRDILMSTYLCKLAANQGLFQKLVPLGLNGPADLSMEACSCLHHATKLSANRMVQAVNAGMTACLVQLASEPDEEAQALACNCLKSVFTNVDAVRLPTASRHTCTALVCLMRHSCKEAIRTHMLFMAGVSMAGVSMSSSASPWCWPLAQAGALQAALEMSQGSDMRVHHAACLLAIQPLPLLPKQLQLQLAHSRAAPLAVQLLLAEAASKEDRQLAAMALSRVLQVDPEWVLAACEHQPGITTALTTVLCDAEEVYSTMRQVYSTRQRLLRAMAGLLAEYVQYVAVCGAGGAAAGAGEAVQQHR